MILVDAGPLVALVDRSHRRHKPCVATLIELSEPMATVWPAVAEALYFLRDVPGGPHAVLEMLGRGAVRLLALGPEDVPRIQELMERRRGPAKDLAKAALFRVAEREGLDRVFTLDRSDFAAYRIGGRKKRFGILPPADRVRAGRLRSRRRRAGARGAQ